MNLLLIEDDPVIARSLQIHLELEKYQVTWAASLALGRQALEQKSPQLLILDLGLPDGSGFQILKSLRESGSNLPVLILTAQTDEDSVVEGLQLGANDYMKKPFGNRELVARIKAILRQPQTKEQIVRFGDLEINIDKRLIKFQETNLELNRREFDILLFITQRAETIVSRETLIQQIDKEGEIFDRTIDSHVSHIRSRFKAAGIESLKIASVYGVGYRLEKR